MTEDERYIEGFNHGYELMTHDPDMAMIISKGVSNNNDPYATAFIHGSLQAVKEQGNARSNDSVERVKREIDEYER